MNYMQAKFYWHIHHVDFIVFAGITREEYFKAKKGVAILDFSCKDCKDT